MPHATATLLEHALAYAQAEIPVIPLHGILTDGSCSCGAERCHSPGKHPRTKNGLKDASTDPRQIEKWWGPTRWPNASIGGVGGTFLCLDIDAKNDGFASLGRLIEAHAPLPDTAVAMTGQYGKKRGSHYWYRVPKDVEVPGSRANVRTGIDIRCAGGYAVLPPSPHASGVNYEWAIGDLDSIAEAPSWILDLAPEFVRGESTWTPDPNFRMAKSVKQFLSGEADVSMGEQRDFLVSAARRVLTTGRTVEVTASLLWEGYEGNGGIESCEWDDDHPWTPEDVYTLVSDIYSKPPTSPLEKDFSKDDFTFDDTGNAERLVSSFKPGHVLFAPGLDQWHVWDLEADRFKPATEGWMHLRWANVAHELGLLAASTRSEGEAKALLSHSKNSRMRPRIEAAVTIAKKIVAISDDELNSDSLLLAVPNGVVDLRDGTIRTGVPDDRIIRHAGVEYHAGATSKLFDQFLERSIPDEELRRYVQLACGYTLTGTTDEDAFFYLYGRPGTGKTTLTEALHHVMGSYAVTADTSTFMRESRRASGPSEDLARLAGARLVTTGEIEKGERLATGLVSRITGGERITARVLYGSTFQYRPRFKLWIAANELPRIASTRSGIWRRVKIIKLDEPLPSAERDPLFRTHKMKEPEVSAAILAWMVEGAVMWREQHAKGHALEEPSIVTAEVEQFQRDSDHVNAFAAEALNGGAEGSSRVSVRQLYEHYRSWCNAEGRERRETQRGLALKLADLGFKAGSARHDGKVQRVWFGVELIDIGSSAGVKVKGATSRRRRSS